jgi:hypothetical protein
MEPVKKTIAGIDVVLAPHSMLGGLRSRGTCSSCHFAAAQGPCAAPPSELHSCLGGVFLTVQDYVVLRLTGEVPPGRPDTQGTPQA